jgi:hypothetical protein
MTDESKKVNTWDIYIFQPNIEFEKQEKKYDLQQFKLIKKKNYLFNGKI